MARQERLGRTSWKRDEFGKNLGMRETPVSHRGSWTE